MSLSVQYQRDGFCVTPDPVLPSDIVDTAIQGMDNVRAGEYIDDLSKCPVIYGQL